MSTQIAGITPLLFPDGTRSFNIAYSGTSESLLLPRIPAGLHSSRAVDAPSAPSGALAGDGAGNVNDGSHLYAVTVVTPAGETVIGTASAAVVVADKTVNGKVDVSAIPLGPLGYTISRKLYRTKAGVPGTFYLLTTLSDNTTTTYEDNTADASLGAQPPSSNTAGYGPALRRPRKVLLTCPHNVYVEFGVTAPTAAAGDILVAAGQTVEAMVPEDAQYIAVVAADGSSSGDLNVQYLDLNLDRY